MVAPALFLDLLPRINWWCSTDRIVLDGDAVGKEGTGGLSTDKRCRMPLRDMSTRAGRLLRNRSRKASSQVPDPSESHSSRKGVRGDEARSDRELSEHSCTTELLRSFSGAWPRTGAGREVRHELEPGRADTSVACTTV
ncbi:hypothetical protein OPV22_010050 [Ensete ventricosum]|uniref:Uncharacterized protein n=1 Tax=Ensete ventricosum TaxID=4639 RepID=A0AAV8RKA5_ENSVE|nr:hypothetical protein OPV22_010050 [Ensete ventricosum]